MIDTIAEGRLRQLETVFLRSDPCKTNLNVIKMEARIRGISAEQLETLAMRYSENKTTLTTTEQTIADTYLAYKNKETAPRYFTDREIPHLEQRTYEQKRTGR